MAAPDGFAYQQRSDGTVVITHHRRVAGTLRGARAAEFLIEVKSGDPQLAMARWTGQYKHGNERTAKRHQRNGGSGRR